MFVQEFDQEQVESGFLMAQVFAKPEFTSKGAVNRAGDLLRDTDEAHTILWPTDWDQTLETINNWRSCHAFPLQVVKMGLLTRAQGVATKGRSKAIVAQRLKRLESIRTKLRHKPNMSLTQMQDIGGCRAILRSMRQVRDVVALYEKSIKRGAARGPIFSERYDYIYEKPKESGYRSFHYVFKYRAAYEQYKCYDGLRIEIQIRSQLQHAWATAVETVSVITNQALKSNVGSDEWKRFFALMGSALAIREKTTLIPGTPTNQRELYDELQFFANKLSVEPVLQGYGTAVHSTVKDVQKKVPDAEVFLVVLNPTDRIVRVTGYPRGEAEKAENEYLKQEKNLDRDKGMQAVLVSVESIKALRRAYPNYFLDTQAFLAALEMAVAK